jgi:hypothetical protein
MAKKQPSFVLAPRPRRFCVQCHKSMEKHQLTSEGMVQRVVKGVVICERPLIILDPDTNLPVGVVA